ncbi:MAG: hypothetical protein ACE5EQ_11805 [Phycisphaerae bacterium]
MPIDYKSPRIHLLPAKRAPRVVIIRRKPSKVFHILLWNTKSDEIEHGSWFRGRLFPFRCDVSFDGRWMVYLAMGSHAETWNGLCRPPWLKTIVDWENVGTWHGGGCWTDDNTLSINPNRYCDFDCEMPELRRHDSVSLPFRIDVLPDVEYSEDFGVLFPRLARDGWQREGELGREEKVKGKDYAFRCVDDPGWVWFPTPGHPRLRMFYQGYSSGRGHTFEFTMQGYPDLLDASVEWATWDAMGQLIVARAGVVHRFTLDDIWEGKPSFSFDLTDLDVPHSDNAKSGKNE